METKTLLIEPLIERIEEYGKTSLELLKLKTVDKAAEVASTFISRAITAFFLSMFIILANIGAGFWLGDVLGKVYYGFFCIAGFYGIIGGVLYFFMNNWIKKRISNSIISQLLNRIT